MSIVLNVFSQLIILKNFGLTFLNLNLFSDHKCIFSITRVVGALFCSKKILFPSFSKTIAKLFLAKIFQSEKKHKYFTYRICTCPRTHITTMIINAFLFICDKIHGPHITTFSSSSMTTNFSNSKT